MRTVPDLFSIVGAIDAIAKVMSWRAPFGALTWSDAIGPGSGALKM